MRRSHFHRRNSYGNQLKALPMEAVYAAGVSILSLILYGVVIGVSVYMSGETPKFIGGLGMLGFVIALCSFIYNLNQMKTNTELKYRIACLIISIVVLIIWAIPFILGLLN
ncbi:hypothetical protein SAMN02910298_01093 [Pseudobutyrivibrio sp. YE44]|uniref:hypothetical protein n=1 Tax=Pseudobutyrivibrio sp. YE44 TaxID=1520802 RepID=UPI00088647DD|nr:hypothetical protein [Pseudobutyrivibrio sp. YE44]SDB22593.1 hypothetical protein SAMN02910298_01093 [Pseudobutyrivibrio sp. YE44]